MGATRKGFPFTSGGLQEVRKAARERLSVVDLFIGRAFDKLLVPKRET